MAYGTQLWCPICEEKKTVYVNPGTPLPDYCHDCAQIEREKEKAAWLEEQAQKPFEDRLREIEEFLWEYRNDTTPHWTPPPRF